MCGISGVFTPGAPPLDEAQRAVLRRMNGTITHRGPDEDGFWFGSGAGLAMRRLSIIDVARNHQPATGPSGRVHCVYNGEIYNYRALRRELLGLGHTLQTDGDTECLPHGYEAWGMQGLLGRLQGMFAFAIVDERDGSLLLARDRMGEKPLYIAEFDGTWVFGSEMKVLLTHPAARREVDPEAIARFLVLEYLPSPTTIYRGITRIEPGTWVRIDRDGRRQDRRYWRLSWDKGRDDWAHPEVPLPPAGEDGRGDWARALSRAVRTAVEDRLVSEVPIGALLSGGVDSSGTAAMMASLVPGVRTFSIAFEDDSFDERRWSRAVAAHIGSRHTERVFGLPEADRAWEEMGAQLDEPFADASVLPTWFLSKTVRDEGVTVVLSGDGADELFAGYPTYLAAKIADGILGLPGHDRALGLARRLLERLPSSYGNVSLDYQARRFLLGLGLPPSRRQATWLGAWTEADALDCLSGDLRARVRPEALWTELDHHGSTSDAVDPLDRLLELDQRSYLPDDILVKVDRASMAASIEARAPLLDHRVVELAARMPARWKLAGREGKAVWKDVVRPLVPRGVVDRKKKGFGMPVARWLRGPWRHLLDRYLGAGAAGRSGWLDQRVVDGLIDDHTSGRRDRRKQLWTLLILRRWQEGEWGPGASSW